MRTASPTSPLLILGRRRSGISHGSRKRPRHCLTWPRIARHLTDACCAPSADEVGRLTSPSRGKRLHRRNA